MFVITLGSPPVEVSVSHQHHTPPGMAGYPPTIYADARCSGKTYSYHLDGITGDSVDLDDFPDHVIAAVEEAVSRSEGEVNGWMLSPWEDHREKRGEDGNYIVSVFSVCAVNLRGDRYHHDYTTPTADRLIALLGRMIREAPMDWSPVDRDHWSPGLPVYGSEAYVAGGGDEVFHAGLDEEGYR